MNNFVCYTKSLDFCFIGRDVTQIVQCFRKLIIAVIKRIVWRNRLETFVHQVSNTYGRVSKGGSE